MIHQIGTAEPRAPLRLIGPEQGHAQPGFPCSRLSGGDHDLVRTAPTRTTLGLSRAGPPHGGALPHRTHRATPRQGKRPAPTGSASGAAHWASPSGPTAACLIKGVVRETKKLRGKAQYRGVTAQEPGVTCLIKCASGNV